MFWNRLGTPMAGRIYAEQVRQIGNLARLKLSDDEVERFGEQLSSILTYVEKLNELDTSDVEPSAHALPVSNVFRNDEPGPTLSPSAAPYGHRNIDPQSDPGHVPGPQRGCGVGSGTD